MVHVQALTLAAIAASVQASLTAQQVVSNIDQITELSAQTNSIAQSISVTNFFASAPQLINNFRQIITVASDDISSMGINKKRQETRIPLETPGTTDVPYSQDGTQCTDGSVDGCLQGAIQIIEDPSELLGNEKRQNLGAAPLIGLTLGNEKRQDLDSVDSLAEPLIGLALGNELGNEKRQDLDGVDSLAEPLIGLALGNELGNEKRQDLPVPVAGPVTANVPVPQNNGGDCTDADVDGCLLDATQIIEDPGQLLGSTKRNHVGGIAARAVAARQAAGYSASSQEAVCNSFRSFVQVHQQLLATVIGKHGLLAATPFTAPMAQVLRTLEGGVDTLAFGIIDLVPTCAQDATQNKANLDQSLNQAIETYSY